MDSSKYIWDFLGSTWDNLPPKDHERFSELWKGFEQIHGDMAQRFFELNKTNVLKDMPVYLTSRWNKYLFDQSTQIIEATKTRAYQDLSLGADLTNLYMLRFSIDGGDPIDIDCRGLIPSNTTIDEIVFRVNQTVGFNFANTIFSNTILQFTTQTVGPTSSIEILNTGGAHDATELIIGLTAAEIPLKVPRLPFKYKLPSSKIRKIPSLQNSIRSLSLTYYLMSGPDFVITPSTSSIAFIEQPEVNLWAKVTYINEEVPYHNFGYLIDYIDRTISPEDYLQNLKGLWFSFWQGPRPDNIRKALYLLFSLPVALDKGVVTQITGASQNIMEILHLDGQTRAYALPSQLNWLVKVGDYVDKFEPLVDGIDVFDKGNKPGFIQTELGRQALSIFSLPSATKGTGAETDETKVVTALEEHTFLPQINVNAFVRPNVNIGGIISFLKNIKPLHKQFYFQIIVAIFKEDLKFSDRFGYDCSLDITPNLDINQANTSTDVLRVDYEQNNIPSLDLDSEDIFFFERGSLQFSDNTGSLPQFDVLFD